MVFVVRLGKFLAIITSNIYSVPFSLSPAIPSPCIVNFFMLVHSFWAFWISFFISHCISAWEFLLTYFPTVLILSLAKLSILMSLLQDVFISVSAFFHF